MKFKHVKKYLDAQLFRALGEAIGDELPRNRLWLLNKVRRELSAYKDLPSNDYNKGYIDALLDIMTAYSHAVTNEIVKEAEQKIIEMTSEPPDLKDE